MSTEKTMSKDHKTTNRINNSRLVYLLVLLAAAAAVLIGILSLNQPNAFSRASARVITQTELQEEYGIQVKLIGVTAEGGLVDVRFKILDVENADPFFSDAEKLPKLMTDAGAIIAVPQSDPHEYKLSQDGMVFMLFSNQGGAIQPGTPVRILFGDNHLEEIEAQ